MPPEKQLLHWSRRPAVQRPLRYARRLLAMTPREVAARIEPHLPRLRTAAAPAPAVDRRRLTGFPFGPERARSILAAWARARPEQATRVVSEARRLLEEVDIFGTPVRLDPQTVDWQAGLDLRGTWELHRQQYLFTLGRAHLVTGEPVFAARVGELFESWWAQNPRGHGVAWSSALEVGVRSISWLWTLPLLLGTLEERSLQRWLASLDEHYEYLRTHLSLYTDPTNHLIGEAAALWILSVALPDPPGAARTAARALAILNGQMQRQISPDGVGREQSTGYLRLVLDFVLQVIAISRRLGRAVPAPLLERTAAALDFLGTLAGAEGETPAIGDSDDARGVPLRELSGTNFRDLLSAGAAVLGRPEWSRGVPESAVWLAGPEAATGPLPDGRGSVPIVGTEPRASASGVAKPRSRVFAPGGYCFFTSEHDGHQMALLFDVGPLGLWPNASHGHADALSVQVQLDGRWVLGDPGTGGYASVGAVRDALRGTASHNTVTVDGLDQTDALEVFKWLNPVETRLLEAVCTDEYDYALAVHEGYRRLRHPVTHYRSVLRVRGGFVVDDRLEGDGRHHGALRFHFPPGTEVSLETARCVTAGGLRLCFSDDCRLETGLWSRRFGEWQEAPVAVVEREAELPLVWSTWLGPAEQPR